MKLTEQQDEKLRAVLRGVFALLGGAISFAKITAFATVGTAVGFFLGVLFMADPDTTTFRDFLLIVQSRQTVGIIIMLGLVFGVIIWVAKILGQSRSVVYPSAAACMGSAKAKLHNEAGHD